MMRNNEVVIAIAQLEAAINELAGEVRAGNKHLETLVGVVRKAVDGRHPPRSAERRDDGIIVFKGKGRRAGVRDNGGRQ